MPSKKRMTIEVLAEKMEQGFAEQRQHTDKRFDEAMKHTDKRFDDLSTVTSDAFKGFGDTLDARFDDLVSVVGDTTKGLGDKIDQSHQELLQGQERIERKQNIQQVLLEKHDERITKLEHKV